MDELERCFVCCVELEENRTALAQCRTGVPHWYLKRVCRECAAGIEETGPLLMFLRDEWWTVRLRSAVLK